MRNALVTGLATLMVGSSLSMAAPVYYTDWTSANFGTLGSALGVIQTNTGPVNVTYTCQVHSPTQTACGTAYWSSNAAIYTGGAAANGPSQDPDGAGPSPALPCDLITMTGGSGIGVSTFSFDRPILSPILSVLSLGQGGIKAQLIFDQAFVILNQGSGYWGGGPAQLTDVNGNARGGDTLLGNEGHGVIMFTGAFETLTWTMPVFEDWYGFTIGVQGIAVPAPGALALLGLGLLGLAARARRAG
jgi:hypothetical protein